MANHVDKWKLYPARKGARRGQLGKCQMVLTEWGVEANWGRDGEGHYVEFAVPAGWPQGKAQGFASALAEAAHPGPAPQPEVSIFTDPFGKPEWVRAQHGRPVPEALRVVAGLMKDWLLGLACAAETLIAEGWSVRYGLFYLRVSHPLLWTRLQAEQRLTALGIGPVASDPFEDIE